MMNTEKALILVSGGVDSVTALYWAKQFYSGILLLSVDYGQRHKKEIQYAQEHAKRLGAEHITLGLPFLANKDLLLTNANKEIPNVTYDDIKGVSPTYVHFRNGTLISAATVCALQNECSAVVVGTHAEDAANDAYPDCRLDFVGAMGAAIHIGTYGKVRLRAPFIEMQKHEIVSVGHKLDVPYEYTWSCYVGDEKHCGQCPTCYARAAAFARAGVADPTEYANQKTIMAYLESL